MYEWDWFYTHLNITCFFFYRPSECAIIEIIPGTPAKSAFKRHLKTLFE